MHKCINALHLVLDDTIVNRVIDVSSGCPSPQNMTLTLSVCLVVANNQSLNMLLLHPIFDFVVRSTGGYQ